MMEERAKQQGYRNGLQTREGRGLGSVWKSLTAHTGLKRKDPCCLRCTAGAVVQAGTPHLSVTSVNVISRMCVLWNRWSWEPASPSAGKHATGVQRARKAVVEGEAGQRRAVKRPRTATARFPPCCSRKALDVRISLTNVTSAGKQTSQLVRGSHPPQGWPWLSDHSHEGPEQDSSTCEMPAEASLTPAGLLLGEEELLACVLMCSPI